MVFFKVWPFWLDSSTFTEKKNGGDSTVAIFFENGDEKKHEYIKLINFI
jgi:hypothetical protein